MKIIAIANQKGGVGKTTTTINLAAALAERGQRILLIDLDPQANATSGLGIAQQPGASLYSCIMSGESVRGKIYSTRIPNLCVVPSHQEMAGCERDMAISGDHLHRLRHAFEPLRAQNSFQYALLDCPPALGTIMTSAIGAADEILVPLQSEFYALDGLKKMQSLTEDISQSINPGLRMEGVLLTMFDARLALANQVAADVQQYFGELLYDTFIPRSVRLAEAPSFGRSILEYDAEGRGAASYRALADEFLKRHTVSPVPVR